MADREVTLDSPVVGVDWWDAAAYAEWKQGATAHPGGMVRGAPAGRGRTRQARPRARGSRSPIETPDRTRTGLLGMAGSVAEWTRRPAVPPDNPAGHPKWVIIGGSYLNQTNGALTREWVDDRRLRRPDLGFRLVFEH